MVGAPHLLSYLEVAEDCTAEEARVALTAKRKRLQSMQSNPKFKDEARYIIKHHHVFLEVVSRPAAHLQEMNLVVLATAIRGVLRAGSITRNQRDRLALDADGLGIPRPIFQSLLSDLAINLGIMLDGQITWDETAQGAERREIHEEVPLEPALLEIVGEPKRQLVGSPPPQEIVIRNVGGPPMTASVITTVPWLLVDTDRLHPTLMTQRVIVTVDAKQLGNQQGVGAVFVETDAGQVATIQYVVQPSRKVQRAMGIAGLLCAIGLVGVFGTQTYLGAVARGAVPGLIVDVEPAADSVRLAGQEVGSGPTIFVQRPAVGDVELEVSRAGYQTAVTQLTIGAGQPQRLSVTLDPVETASFQPGPDSDRGRVKLSDAVTALAPHREALNRCVSQHLRPAPGADPSRTDLVVYVGAEGDVIGFEFEGDGADRPALRKCAHRHLAAARFEKLNRDYAELRYAYRVYASDP